MELAMTIVGAMGCSAYMLSIVQSGMAADGAPFRWLTHQGGLAAWAALTAALAFVASVALRFM